MKYSICFRIFCLISGSLFTVLNLAGCGSRGQMEVLEARIRQQETMLAHANSQLSNTQRELEVARRETELIRNQALASGDQFALPEQTQPVARLKKIEFNSLLTGPVPSDPGQYSVILTPQDSKNSVVQVPGNVTIRAFHVKRNGRQEKVGQWDYEPHQAQAYWQQGFLASGYTFTLPIAGPVSQDEKIQLSATLKTTDGRVFETSHQISDDVSVPSRNVSISQPRPQLPDMMEYDSGASEITSDNFTTESIPVLR